MSTMSSFPALLFASLLLSTALCYVDIDENDSFVAFKRFETVRASVRKAFKPKANAVRRTARNANDGHPCEWNRYEMRCGMSFAHLEKLFKQSSSPLSEFLLNFVRCRQIEDATKCRASKGCGWDRSTEDCDFEKISTGYEDSVCVSDAPLFFKEMSIDEECYQHEDLTTCQADHSCEWDDDDASCDADVYLLYFGFTSEQLSAGIRQRAGHFIKAFRKEFDVKDPSFTWDKAFEWDGLSLKCSADLHPRACEFVDYVLKRMIPKTEYCESKATGILSVAACRKDPLCDFDMRTLTCSTSSATRVGCFAEAYEKSSAYIKSEVDRNIWKNAGACLKQLNEKDCQGDCVWKKDDGGRCSYRTSALMSLIADHKGGDDDPLCQFFKASTKDKCDDISDQRKCKQCPECYVDEDEDCQLKDSTYVKAALASDERLLKSFNSAESKCSKHKSKNECDKAKIMI